MTDDRVSFPIHTGGSFQVGLPDGTWADVPVRDIELVGDPTDAPPSFIPNVWAGTIVGQIEASRPIIEALLGPRCPICRRRAFEHAGTVAAMCLSQTARARLAAVLRRWVYRCLDRVLPRHRGAR